MNQNHQNIFSRMQKGGIIEADDPELVLLWNIVNETIVLSAALNIAKDLNEIRENLGKITAKKIDETTTVFIPFHTNFGRHITLGKNVFINHGCSFLDLGGITIEDDVLIGPKVCITTENHPIDPLKRKNLDLKKVVLKRNCWIGANVTILPGVTIGENSIVAAGAVVNKDVPNNSIVAGVPAKEIKKL